MVFQKPNPFPKSIFENVAFGLRLEGVETEAVLDDESKPRCRRRRCGTRSRTG